MEQLWDHVLGHALCLGQVQLQVLGLLLDGRLGSDVVLGPVLSQ